MSSASSLTGRTVGGLLWTAGATAAQALLQIATLAVLARLLTPEAFGVVGLALIVVRFTELFSQLGLGPALIQRPTLEVRHVRTAFTVLVLLSVLLSAGLWWSADVISGLFHVAEHSSVLRAIALVFPIQAVGGVADALLQRELRFRRLGAVRLVAYAAGYGGVGITAAVAGYGVWALVAANLAVATLGTVLLLASRPHAWRPLVDLDAFRDLWRFGGGFTLGQVGFFTAANGDNLVVGRLLGPSALGVYGRAYQLMSMPAVLVGQVLDRVLFPVMASVQGEREKLRAAFLRGTSMTALAMLPTSGVLIVLAPELVALFLGDGWEGAVAPFRILAAGMLFRSAFKLSEALARAVGAVVARAVRQWAYAAMVVLGASAGSRWGLAGVATGVLIAIFLNFVLMAQLARKLVGLSWGTLARAHVPALAVAGFAAATSTLTAHLLRRADLGDGGVLVLAALAGVGGGGLLVVMFPRTILGPDGLSLVRLLVRSFRCRVGEATMSGGDA